MESLEDLELEVLVIMKKIMVLAVVVGIMEVVVSFGQEVPVEDQVLLVVMKVVTQSMKTQRKITYITLAAHYITLVNTSPTRL